MNKYAQWAERARSSYEVEKVFASGTQMGEPCGQLFFGVVRKNVGAIGTYVELYQNKLLGALTANVLVYSAPYKDVSEEVRAEQFVLDLERNKSGEVELIAPPVVGGCIYRIAVCISYSATQDSGLALCAARARLDKDYSAAREYRFFDIDIPPVTWPDRKHNVRLSGRYFGRFATAARALCPNCFGIGSFATMKIPRADWESGATGYQLYSCNQLNGREACDVCGGSGGKYLKWYLDENPQLRKSTFIPGSGLLLT